MEHLLVGDVREHAQLDLLVVDRGSTLPGSAMKQGRITRPVSVRIGMFCRFGLIEASRPVAAFVWRNVVCRRPGFPIQAGSASR